MNWSDINEALSHLSEPFYLCTFGLILALSLLLLLLLKRQPKRLVAYQTDNGSVTVSRSAIVELVRTSCEQFKEIAKPSIKIYIRGKHTHLTVYIKFMGGSRLREVEKTLQNHLRQNLSENLGIEHLGTINIIVTGFKSGQITSTGNTSRKSSDFNISSRHG